MKSKIIVGFHGHCMDGLGALAVMVNRFGEDSVIPVPLSHSKKDESFNALLNAIEAHSGDIKAVTVLDFCFDKEKMFILADETEEEHCHFLVIDHHAGMKDVMDMLVVYTDDHPHADVVFDIGASGAMLTDDFYQEMGGRQHVAEIPVLSYISDADRWVWELPNSKDVNAMLEYLTERKDVQVLISLFGKTALELIDMANNEYSFVRRYVDDTATLYLTGGKTVNLQTVEGGIKAYVKPCDLAFSSVLGARIYEALPEVDAVVLYSGKEKEVFCSVRSSEGHAGSALAVARMFGGNGHPNAAGFRMSREAFCNLFLNL